MDVASDDMARSLLPRIDDIHARRIAPILEQVLNEVDVEGAHVVLQKLDIDLGTLPFSRFEEALAERLPGELRRALADAVRQARERPSPEAEARPEGAAWLDLLEHALLHATWPFWAPTGQTLSLEALMTDLAERDPEGLARLLRRHRGRRDVLVRIASTLGGAALARLLRALDPENAALILAYLLDLETLHREETLVDLGEEVFGRTLWVLVLQYELRDPGTQWNRRSFVISLIEGLAMAEGVEAADLFAALARGLRWTARSRPLTSSLPAVLEEIFADRDRQSATGEGEGQVASRGLLDALDHWLAHGAPPAWAPGGSSVSFEALISRALEADPGGVTASILRVGRHDRALRFIVDSLGEPARARLLRALSPDAAALIIAYLADIRVAHRREAWTRLDGEAFGRRIWVLTLTYVVRDPGTQWNRKSFVRSLLQSMAASESVPYADLLLTVRAALARTEGRRPLDASLPAILRELSDDLEREGEIDAVSLPIGGALESDEGARASRARSQDRHEAERAALAFLLGEDRVGSWPREALLDALETLLDTPSPDLSAIVALHLTEPRVRDRWAKILPRSILIRLVARGMEAGSLGDHGEALIQLLGDKLPPPGADPAEALFALLEREMVSGEAGDRGEGLSRLRASRSRLRARSRYGAAGAAGATDPRVLAEVRARVLDALLGRDGATGGGLSEEALIEALTSMLEEPSAELSAFLARPMADPRVRARWAKLLPESVLARITAAVAPRNHEALIGAARLLSSAWASVAPGGGAIRDRATFWDLLMDILSARGGRELSVEALASAIIERFALSSRGSPSDAAALGERFLERALRLAGDAGQTALVHALQAPAPSVAVAVADLPFPRPDPDRETGGSATATATERDRRTRMAAPSPQRPLRGKHAFRLGGSETGGDLGGQPIFIDNAGLVLTAPFLPRLFEMLGMLGVDEEGKTRIRDHETASRAVHLLQYLVDGRTDAPEPALPLAKILCGVPTDAPIAPRIEPTQAERDACERLLRSVIARWGIIPNTSIAGLRETFLQREGKLVREPDRFLLRVERKTVDILVDQIPWSIAIVYHAFMPYPLHVTW